VRFFGVYFVGDTNTDRMVPNVDAKQDEHLRPTELNSFYSPQHNSERNRVGGQYQNLHAEGMRQSAHIYEQQQMDMKLKGDSTDDDMSWKQWKEQHRKMDFDKESFRQLAGTSLQGIPEKTMPRSHRPLPDPRSDESGHGSMHKKIVSGMSAESKDVLNKRSDSVDVNEVHSDDDEHVRSHDHLEETDPELAEDLQNVRNEQLLKTEHTVNSVSPETAAGDAEIENIEGLSASEEPSGKGTSQKDTNRGAEEDSELPERLDDRQDEDEAETPEENAAYAIEHEASEEPFDEGTSQEDSDRGAEEDSELPEGLDDRWDEDEAETPEENAAYAIEHKAVNSVKDSTFHSEAHFKSASEPSAGSEELPQNVDVGQSDTARKENDVLESDSADVDLNTSTGTLDAIYSFFAAIVDMVRHNIFLYMFIFVIFLETPSSIICVADVKNKDVFSSATDIQCPSVCRFVI